MAYPWETKCTGKGDRVGHWHLFVKNSGLTDPDEEPICLTADAESTHDIQSRNDGVWQYLLKLIEGSGN